MGNKAACPTAPSPNESATMLMPLPIMCWTHLVQASSVTGGSPWKEFLGSNARYMAIMLWQIFSSSIRMRIASPFLVINARGLR